MNTLDTAVIALERGFSFLPIKPDGSKAPALKSWTEYMERRPSKVEVYEWFKETENGIAIVGGKVSGNLEILDFDVDAWANFYKWRERMIQEGYQELLNRVVQGYTEESPKPGVHLLWRCDGTVEGSRKLAQRYKLDEKGERIKKGSSYEREVLVETKGEGGYCIISPSSGGVHPSGRPYTLFAGGLEKVATITPSERDCILRLASELNEVVETPVVKPVSVVNNYTPGHLKAGDDFNARGDWEQILTSAGWRLLRRHPDGKLDWVKPGSDSHILHATTGAKGADVFYCFSSATEFEQGKPYSKFAVYAMLHHNNDYSAAAKQLTVEGYGTPVKKTGGIVFSKHEEQKEVGEDLDLTRFPANDEGNALAFMEVYGSDFKFSNTVGYLFWDGKKWAKENADAAFHEKVVEVLTQRYNEALGRSEAVCKVAIPNAMRVSFAKQMITPKIACTIDMFDQHPDLLNVANGVVDLRTGELLDHNKDFYFTHCVNVEYHPDAVSDTWLKFLRSAVSDPDSMIPYLQLAIGYSLTGRTNEEILFFLYGPPRSGKGTFTETLLALLGKDLSTEVDFQTFASKRDGDTNNFDLAPLKAARAVFASESERHDRLNSGKIKALTGGNYVRCCFKHREHFQYQPMYKIWLSSNWGPNGDADDGAMWSRVRVITFPHSHVGTEDKSFKTRMRSKLNLEGVLAWAVEGARLWYDLDERGLITPDQVKKDTEEHRQQADALKDFLEECTIEQPNSWVSNSVLWPAYENWCKLNGVPAKNQKAFAASLAAKGFSVGIRNRVNGVQSRGVQGLRVNIQ